MREVLLSDHVKVNPINSHKASPLDLVVDPDAEGLGGVLSLASSFDWLEGGVLGLVCLGGTGGTAGDCEEVDGRDSGVFAGEGMGAGMVGAAAPGTGIGENPAGNSFFQS